MTRGIPFAGPPDHDWRSRAADVIPGGCSTGSRRPDVLYGSRALDAAVPTHFERADGCYLWSPDGRRLFYLNGNDLMAATLSVSRGVTVSARERVLTADVAPGGIHANYDVAKDGRHFLMVRNAGGSTDLTIVLNWLESARKRVAR